MTIVCILCVFLEYIIKEFCFPINSYKNQMYHSVSELKINFPLVKVKSNVIKISLHLEEEEEGGREGGLKEREEEK